MNCKYCKLPAQNDCVSLCACKGSVALVHRSCLVDRLAMKKQEPLWRCKLCHSDIRYTFGARSLLPSIWAFVQTLASLHKLVLHGGTCVCRERDCACPGLLAWSRRSRSLLLKTPFYGSLLWLFLKLSSFGAMPATVCQSLDCTAVLFEVYIAADLIVSTLRKQNESVVGPATAVTFALSCLAHHLLPSVCGSRFVGTWLMAAAICLIGATYLTVCLACRQFRRARLLAEAQRCPVAAE